MSTKKAKRTGAPTVGELIAALKKFDARREVLVQVALNPECPVFNTGWTVVDDLMFPYWTGLKTGRCKFRPVVIRPEFTM